MKGDGDTVMKRIISICVLALCVLFSSGLVWAEDGESSLNERQSEAISLVNDLGIFSDVTEENAQTALTRGEFAKIIVNVLGAGDYLSENPKRIYTDVLPDHEAAAEIEYLYNRGIMLGYDNAEFRPDDQLKVEEAATVLVKVLGYTNWAEYGGGWADGYYTLALSKNILNGVVGARGEVVTFADVAVMIQNVLESDEFVVLDGYENGYPVETTHTGMDYMSYALGIYSYTGVVEAVGETALSDAATEYQEFRCRIGGEMFNMNDNDMMPYLGMTMKVYYREDNGDYLILHITEDDDNIVTEVEAEDLMEGTTRSQVNYTDGNRTRTADIAGDAIFVYNGKRLEVVSDADMQIGNGYVRLISNDGNDEADVVIIKEYDTYIVNKAVVTDSILHFKYGRESMDLSGDEYHVKYYMDGDEAEFANITNGSVLSIAMSKNLTGNILVEVYISNNQITASAVSIEDSGNTRIVTLEDESQYVYTNEFMQRIEDGEQNTYEPELNSEGVYYIDYFNKLAAYTVVSSGKNYGYLVKAWYDANEEYGEVRLFTKDAEFINLTFNDDVSLNSGKIAKDKLVDALKSTGESGDVYQLVIYDNNDDNELTSIKTAVDKTGETATNGYYIATEDEFVLNYVRVTGGMRFYKNMAEHLPFCFVDGQTIQFMVPENKRDEKQYSIATKPETTDVSFPSPIYIYDAGASGCIGAIVTSPRATNTYNTPVVINKTYEGIDDDGNICTGLEFANGTKMLINADAELAPIEGGRWEEAVDYSGYTFSDLKRGDVVEYTTDGNNINRLRIVVKSDNIGGLRLNGTDQEWIQRSGNMVAEIISVADNGRTALVKYSYKKGGEITYQTMLVNGPTYRYDSTEDMVYNSSTSDLMAGDIVLINSFWWSPNLVVIFR